MRLKNLQSFEVKIPHMSSAHACDTESKVVSFIPSITMVGNMYGGRSPISVGVMVSPKAALTVHDAGRRFLSLFLRPVPEVEAPLSMITLFLFVSIARIRCDGPTACRRLSLALLLFRSFGSTRLAGAGDVRSTTGPLTGRERRLGDDLEGLFDAADPLLPWGDAADPLSLWADVADPL